jgi:hypothetical protein
VEKIIFSIFAIIVLGIVFVYFFMPGTMFGFVQKMERYSLKYYRFQNPGQKQ